MQEYTLRYAQENSAMLEAMGMESFRKTFRVSDDMLMELVELAEGNKLPFNEEDFNKSKKLLQQLTKAYIARGIWDNEGFYPIFNEQDEIFQKAIRLMDEADELALR